MRSIVLRNKKALGRVLISVFLINVFLLLPGLVFGQEQGSIDALRQMGKAFAGIAEKASPAVVGVKAERTVTQEQSGFHDGPFGDPFDDEFFKFFFGPQHRQRRAPQQQTPQQRAPKQRKSIQRAQGSGFIISSDGYILTNNHLVGEAEKVSVKLGDGRDFEAKIIGTDPDSDIAVLKIDAKELVYLELADSDALEVGEWVIAIGNPFRLSHTVTAGIVSAKGRSNVGLVTYEDFIQTDAAINPGNSGGPLLNLDGKVVGINTAIISRSGGNMGIGLAIPVNMAKGIYEQLIESGKVVRGFLGVSIQDLTLELAEKFELEDTKGVLLSEVMADSAAEKAGLEKGDIVLELDGKEVAKANELQRRVAMLKPGTKVKLVVLRNGKRKSFKVKLGERPGSGGSVPKESESLEQLGFSVQELTDELAERLGYKGESGVLVTQVEDGSLAATAGIRQGTLILEVGRKSVDDVKEFNKAIKKAGKEGSVLLLIKDKRFTRFVVLKLPEK